MGTPPEFWEASAKVADGQTLAVPYFTRHPSARPQSHVIVVQRHQIIRNLLIPMLYVDKVETPNNDPIRPLDLIVEYNIAHSALELQARRHVSRALGLLIDFVRSSFGRNIIEHDEPGIDQSYRLLTRFASCLISGTQDSTALESHANQIDLNWLPATSIEVVHNLLDGLKNFFVFLQSHKAWSSVHSAWFDSLPITAIECIRHTYSDHIRNNLSIFSDLKSLKPEAKMDFRFKAVPKSQTSPRPSPTRRFPPDLLRPLISDGFILHKPTQTKGVIEDDTCKLKALLEASFGFRSSETLHIWVSDISVVNGQPCGRLKHPCFAKDWFDGRLMSRQQRLLHEFGRVPRNLLDPGGEYAGWKGVLLEKDYSIPLYLAPYPGISVSLSESLLRYVSGARRKAMDTRLSQGLPDHPYLLVTCSSPNTEEIGQPYTIAAARGAWSRAIERLNHCFNDRDITVSKMSGTTPHGLRHLYGYSMAEIGLNERQIQMCMRHVSPISSRVYTQPDPSVISEILNRSVEDRLQNGDMTSLATNKSLGEIIDGLFDAPFLKRRYEK